MAHEIKVLDGFNRFKKDDPMSANMFNRFGVGSTAGTDTLQGFNRILQGYKQGTKSDLADWEFLVNIEHPEVLNGFENFVSQGQDPMNGKKRQERREKKEQKKAEKKQEKATKPRAVRKDKREDRKAATKARKDQKKNIRVAKKEQRVQKKINRDERKDQRLADRKINRQERQETRRDRTERFADAFKGIGSGVGGALLSNIAGGEGVFQDMTFSDIPQSMIPGRFQDLVSSLQDMPAEDALETRDQLIDDAAEDVSGSPAGDSGESGGMMMPLMIAAGGLLLLSGKKKKGKK